MNHRVSTRNLSLSLAFTCLIGGMLYFMISPWMRSEYAEVNTIYGRRRSRGRNSVNGTSVLADMFAQRGARVTSWHQLSPRLKRSDVIVWTPDSFNLPSAPQIDFLESDWLADGDRPRTLIYVGRDYNAAIMYWQQQLSQADGAERLEAQRQRGHAIADHAFARSTSNRNQGTEWCGLQFRQHFEKVTPNQGAWASVIDPTQTEIYVATTFELPTDAKASQLNHEILLGTEQTPLIVRLTNERAWPDGQVILVLNGFPVLNYALVNHEHRKIAGQLLDACGQPDRVTFLETGRNGPRVSRQDSKAYSGFEALTVWPINSILLHLIIAGILFCLMVFPIFGRAREMRRESPSDFSKHIKALGDLLALTNDRTAALEIVRQYRSLHPDAPTTKVQDHAAQAEPTAKPGNPFQVTPPKPA